ncbi:hypothetical protein B4U80_04431 [Leptotrombidium deliense]|uniref:FMP27/BLTP2/Hobbit GFWDK motif-containing RBG unit domain-containing protein n=1 Tax=Leptotrombidium deliense TaxID=299467 RepID=A0A443SSR5_9ACAR|nr:hypothetical protein B4U80_04431 [Leptotrombidium deliense]
MIFAAITALLFVIFIFISFKIFLFLVCWHINKKYNIKVYVNSFSPFKLHGILLKLNNGFFIEIESVGLTSCLWNSKHERILGFTFVDVRLQGNPIEISDDSKNEFDELNVMTKLASASLVESVRQKLYSMPLLKMFSVHVYNLSFMQLGISGTKFSDKFLLNTTAQELRLHFESAKKNLRLSVSLNDVCFKLLKHGTEETCLAQMFASLLCSIVCDESDLPEIVVTFTQLEFSLYDSLPFSIQRRQSAAVKSTNVEMNIINLLTHIPVKRCVLHFKNSSLKLIREHGQKALSLQLSSAEFEFAKTINKCFEVKLQLGDILSCSDNIQLLLLNKFILVTKVEEESLLNNYINMFLVMEVTCCHLNVDCIEIQYWINCFHEVIRFKKDEMCDTPVLEKKSMIENFFVQNDPNLKIGFSMDLNALTLNVIPEQTSGITCTLLHAKINSMIEPDPLLKEYSYEFLVDSFICESNSKNTEEVEGNVSLRSVIFKFHCATLSEVKIHCASDTVVVDMDFLLNMLNEFVTNNISYASYSTDKHQKKFSDLSVTQIAFNSTSTTFLSKKLKLHIGVANIDSDSAKFASVFKDASIHSLTPLVNNEPFTSSRKILYISEGRLLFNHNTLENSLTFTDDIYFQWNVYFHLSVADFVKDASKAFESLKPKTISKKKPSTLKISFSGSIQLGALLSNSSQTIFLAMNSLIITSTAERIDVKSDVVFLNFDEHEIGDFQKVEISFLSEGEALKVVNRKNVVENIEVKCNRLAIISIDTIWIKFPYKYNFANTFNEKLLTIIKWLKKRKVKKDTIEEMNSDILVRVGSLSVEVSDDPFEVKLRDNYELMEDEFREGLKRSAVLNERLLEYQKRNVIFASSKLNELQTALTEKTAEIYIKRHNQLYKSVPMRTRLFSINAELIETFIFSDSSLTGYNKLVEIIRRLDKESQFPEEIRFSSLWGRFVEATVKSFSCRLRDFPQHMLDIRKLKLNGLLIGAEQEASSRAFRTCFIDTLPSMPPLIVERSMTAMKLYHDIRIAAESIAYTHGACWEPVLQQVNLCFEFIIMPSKDPSPSLTWWDRMRFLFHGPLRIMSENISLFFHSSLNPYNSSEFIEICFTKSTVDWLFGRINVKGDFDLLIHTASKHDECRIVHLPKVKITIELLWHCLGAQNDHHSVMPCAADKIPDYSSHQTHDSYRAFRSQNLSVMLSIESEPDILEKATDTPLILLYSSTLRWLENQKSIFAGIARLTRRGRLFKNTKPRKTPFSRIFKNIRVTLHLHKLKVLKLLIWTVLYWSNFAKQFGCEISGRSLFHSAQHSLTFVAYSDELIRRPRPVWEMAYMNSEIRDAEVWLHYNKKDFRDSIEDISRMYFLSLSRVSYNRESNESSKKVNSSDDFDARNTPNHRLVLHDLKGAWTKDNRTVVISLFDMYMKVEQLKKNLSTDALKGFKIDDANVFGGTSPVKAFQKQHSRTSPSSTIKGNAVTMLQKLIAESEINPNTVYTEDVENEIGNDELKLKGVSACTEDDIIQRNWLIELVNSQVMLRGSESLGYVIASAAKTQIWQNVHRPVWKEHTLYSKTTWVGSVECMQYYGTVEAGRYCEGEDVVWLNIDNIAEKKDTYVNDIPDLVGSGRSAGGVVTAVVGTCDGSDYFGGTSPIQLQRIISRCGCKFFYVNYTEGFDVEIAEAVPPLPKDSDLLLLEPWDREIAVDSFTLTHDDLDVSTNSQQFHMIMDLVNNLLLYVEPHKKEAYEKLQRLKFKMQLSSVEEQKEPILQFQDDLRLLVFRLKELERESYIIKKTLEDQSFGFSSDSSTLELRQEENEIDAQIEKYTEQVNKASDELALMISCFKEAQISADKNRERQLAAESGGTFIASVVRRIEICFKQASWRLTDSDGQLGLSDIVLKNFLYTKVAKNDDSVEHTLQLGSIYVLNLLPNPVYDTVLQPTELKPNIPLDRHYALRVFCREMAPVGGISVKEHFEVNVIPLTICITYAFFKSMLKFFFPERSSDNSSSADISETSKVKKSKKPQKDDSISIESSSTAVVVVPKGVRADDIDKMRERALKNQTFVYIKIPEVPITVSYRGRKDKSIMNINNFGFILPTVEYHNQTWTWLDLLMAIKNESKHRLLHQAVKQKLKPFFSSSSHHAIDENVCKESTPSKEEEEHKARLLLGDLAVGGQPKIKFSLFGNRKH